MEISKNLIDPGAANYLLSEMSAPIIAIPRYLLRGIYVS